MFEKLIPYDAAYLIMDDYLHYHHKYKRITKRAKIRFEKRDWIGTQSDARERIMLYRETVGDTTQKVVDFLGDQAQDPEMWRSMRQLFLDEVLNFNSRNIAETFYNSVFRHSHRGLSVDEEQMFVHATGTYREFKSTLPIYHSFYLVAPYEHTVRQIVACFPFDVPFANLAREIAFLCDLLRQRIQELPAPRNPPRIELLKSVFFRNKGAYLVGRMALDERMYPFVIPLVNEEDGLHLDALLLEDYDVSSIFSYNRSYFLVDTDIASEMVDFLRTILPNKSMGELYNSIGFEKHGKTVLYRDFLRHLGSTDDQFVVAPGIKGMVMAVFTLPSYNMVFKIIKDKFAAPKTVTEREVKEKYELVSFHDRVGRMADSHTFEHFAFELRRFSPELLDELLKEAPSKISIEGDRLVIKHMYIEKRMVPLNLYLEKATPEEAEEVIIEYGKAIKQLAAVNIFPGDMLLKNFGVTRLKRVVFYDYDEICFITDCNFRRIPEASRYEDELSSEPWYSVGVMDVFPEEFPRFLIGRSEIRDIFFRRHGNLYDVTYWTAVQERLRQGEIFDFYPYRRRLRFRNLWAEQAQEAELDTST